MAATMDHLSHDAPICFLLLLWVVFYVGIRRVTYHTIGDTLPTSRGSDHGQQRSCRLGSHHAESVTPSRPPIRYIVRKRCMVVVVAMDEEEAV